MVGIIVHIPFGYRVSGFWSLAAGSDSETRNEQFNPDLTVDGLVKVCGCYKAGARRQWPEALNRMTDTLI